MSIALLALALAFTEPAAAPQLSVATGDWSNIPLAKKKGMQSFTMFAMAEVDNALTTKCIKRDRRNQPVDMAVPFLIEFGANRSVKRVVVQKINCPAAETIIGSAVMQLAKNGEFQPTGENDAGWYRGEFAFYSRN